MQPLSMDIASTDLTQDKRVLRLDAVTGGYDPENPVIRDFSLTITGPERIAISGQNGSGKSTLLALITGRLAAFSGTIETPVPLAFLDQHVGLLDSTLSLRDNFRALDPTASENDCRAALARFRFRTDDALRLADSLSGGERLRAGLACVLGAVPAKGGTGFASGIATNQTVRQKNPPHLLILDEPTNHLDLETMETLETALAAYDGALLVVSHDQAFLERIGIDRTTRIENRRGLVR